MAPNRTSVPVTTRPSSELGLAVTDAVDAGDEGHVCRTGRIEVVPVVAGVTDWARVAVAMVFSGVPNCLDTAPWKWTVSNHAIWLDLGLKIYMPRSDSDVPDGDPTGAWEGSVVRLAEG